jgi:citrate lyase subunit beta / citryl-CoA lyase
MTDIADAYGNRSNSDESRRFAELLTAASSFLFVPGNRPDRFAKAANSGADMVIVDLEDSVPATEKTKARDHVAAWCETNRCVVRINGVATPWHRDDLEALAGRKGLVAIMLPKAADPTHAESVSSTTGALIVALVETAQGIVRSAEVAASKPVARLAFGNLDFIAECGIAVSPDEYELLAARSALVIASHAAGLPGPIDGVFSAIGDTDGLSLAAGRARRLGFAGKLCLHPEQVAVVRRQFEPTKDELDWAHQVLSAHSVTQSPSLFMLDGNMIDEPVIRRARALVARAASSRIAHDSGDLAEADT